MSVITFNTFTTESSKFLFEFYQDNISFKISPLNDAYSLSGLSNRMCNGSFNEFIKENLDDFKTLEPEYSKLLTDNEYLLPLSIEKNLIDNLLFTDFNFESNIAFYIIVLNYKKKLDLIKEESIAIKNEPDIKIHKMSKVDITQKSDKSLDKIQKTTEFLERELTSIDEELIDCVTTVDKISNLTTFEKLYMEKCEDFNRIEDLNNKLKLQLKGKILKIKEDQENIKKNKDAISEVKKEMLSIKAQNSILNINYDTAVITSKQYQSKIDKLKNLRDKLQSELEVMLLDLNYANDRIKELKIDNEKISDTCATLDNSYSKLMYKMQYATKKFTDFCKDIENIKPSKQNVHNKFFGFKITDALTKRINNKTYGIITRKHLENAEQLLKDNKLNKCSESVMIDIVSNLTKNYGGKSIIWLRNFLSEKHYNQRNSHFSTAKKFYYTYVNPLNVDSSMTISKYSATSAGLLKGTLATIYKSFDNELHTRTTLFPTHTSKIEESFNDLRKELGTTMLRKKIHAKHIEYSEYTEDDVGMAIYNQMPF